MIKIWKTASASRASKRFGARTTPPFRRAFEATNMAAEQVRATTIKTTTGRRKMMAKRVMTTGRPDDDDDRDGAGRRRREE